ncbi:MAG: hypothetical protein LBS10_04435 [Gracilibacteraceae bacterium]|jgi:hypothetical protein|nr:hypothetical protein [Gracilibacteraceae bacterium]
MVKDEFLAEREAALSEEKRREKMLARYGLGRVLSFLAAAVAAAGALSERSALLAAAALVLLAVFILLVHRSLRAREEKTLAASRRIVIEGFLSRLDASWQKHGPTGEAFLTDEFPPGRDLDIFGPGSLYQYLSLTHTPWGREALSRLLTEPGQSGGPEVLAAARTRQEAVRELLAKKDFVLEFAARSRLPEAEKNLSAQNLEEFRTSAAAAPWPAALVPLFWLAPAVTLAALVLALVGLTSFLPFAVCFLLQFLARLAGGKALGPLLGPLAAFRRSLRHIAPLLALIEREPFTSDYLRRLREPLTAKGGAARAIAALAAVEDMAAWRFQPIAYFFATGILMWDFHAACRLLAWKARHAADLTPWLTAVGETEALMSLATIGFTRDTYCFPDLLPTAEPLLQLEELVHPLLDPAAAVANSLTLAAGVCVLTGSNMSGKTTFLRSIGLALVLAYAGGPVCARAGAVSGLRLFSSLRVWDDVNLGVSTFYAEILRIRAMVAYSAEKAPMLALIDEIYKGTNTADRVVGAEATLKKMSAPWIICVVATHDFELCELENDEGVKARNCHFAEHYAGDELRFDYKLRPGRCQTTNARHILRMAGLL